jgi:CRP/FNR family transcriptional regulator, cyclic AMP receptor protein
MPESVLRRREMLANTPLFSSVQPELLDELAAKAKMVKVEAREILFSKGDPGDRLYLVATGMIRIGVLSADGREVTYGLIKPGQLFGEIAVLDGKERSADATAMDSTELIALERKDVHAFLHKHPAQALHLIEVLCDRIRKADDQLEDLVFLSLPSRLAKHLLMLEQNLGTKAKAGGPSTIKLSQQEIADHLGISRESVNKVLSKWEQAGIVTLGRGQITLNKTAALEGLTSLD